jgi:hypothetical protein
MRRFIESHGEVRKRERGVPSRDHVLLLTVHDDHSARRRHVDECPGPVLFELERLRMPGKRDLARGRTRRRIQEAQRPVSVAHDDLARNRVVAHVVGVGHVADPLHDREGAGIHDVDAIRPSIRDVEPRLIRQVQHALRLAETRDAPVLVTLDSHDLDGVVPQRRYEEAMPLHVERKMVDASLHLGKLDRVGEVQGHRSRRCRSEERPREQHRAHREGAAHTASASTRVP